MRSQWQSKPVWRHAIWQGQAPMAPQRWPLKLSVLVFGGLCVGAWVLLGSVLFAAMN
jgi:hypothetical protein